MHRWRRIYSFDYMGHKKWWFTISAVIIVAGLASLFIRGGGNPVDGLTYGLEFKTGTRLIVVFDEQADVGAVRDAVTSAGFPGAVVQQIKTTGAGSKFQVQTDVLSPEQSQRLQDALDKDFSLATDANGKFAVEVQTVSPAFGKQVISASWKAALVAILLILGYITLRFEWKFAIGAIAAEFHDLLIVVGVYSITGREVTTATIAAVLTILGYSLYDTVIVYDRIRENAPKLGRVAYGDIVNRSIWETLTRSINTTVLVLLPVLCLLFFGGGTLKDFAFALLVGIISGAYSSIFVASPVLTILKERESRYRKLAAARTQS